MKLTYYSKSHNQSMDRYVGIFKIRNLELFEHVGCSQLGYVQSILRLPFQFTCAKILKHLLKTSCNI